MKAKIISKILLTLSLVFVLGSTVAPMRGGTQSGSASEIGPPDQQVPVITIHTVASSGIPNASGLNASIEDLTRGQTGVFVLTANPKVLFATTFVKFTVSGTAVPGVDYVPLVSPVFIGRSGFGVLLVKTLADLRASIVPQARSVVVTLEPAPGYAVGAPSSAEILIKP